MQEEDGISSLLRCLCSDDASSEGNVTSSTVVGMKDRLLSGTTSFEETFLSRKLEACLTPTGANVSVVSNLCLAAWESLYEVVKVVFPEAVVFRQQVAFGALLILRHALKQQGSERCLQWQAAASS